MDRRLALISMLAFWRLLHSNGERRLVEFHRRSKQLAAKCSAARRRLKAKQCLQFAMFQSENFQMSKETFLYLCQELGHTISRQDTHMRKALPSEMRVAITLWCLGTNDSYRTVGHLYLRCVTFICVSHRERGVSSYCQQTPTNLH